MCKPHKMNGWGDGREDPTVTSDEWKPTPSKKKGRKKYLIEVMFVSGRSRFPWANRWVPWKRYRTKKDRDKAFKACKIKEDGTKETSFAVRYRIPEDEDGEAKMPVK